ncbi:Ankyrin repeat domain-containing protein 39 [Mactra antiquata]
MSVPHHSHTGSCCHNSSTPSVQQTLDELDFTRGIWSAALDGCYDDVEACLRKQIAVDATDSSGYTALHYASRNGHLSVCELLLENKASTNVQTKSGGVTPLHRAAYCGHVKIVKLLLRYHADPCISDTDGKLPLHKAAERGHTEVTRILLEASPKSKTYKDKKEQTALECVPDGYSDLKSLLDTG